MAFDFINAELQKKQDAGYLRRRHCVEYEKDGIICVAGEHYLNFASNDYLGMRQHPGVLQRRRQRRVSVSDGLHTGTCGP